MVNFVSLRHCVLTLSAVSLVVLLSSGCEEKRPFDYTTLVPPEGKYDVEIIRDDLGVPHIYGKTDADVAYGLGWAQTEDDFKHTYETMLMARGQFANAAGMQGAPFDFLVALFGFRKIVDDNYETQLSPEVRAICEAYADGFNHYVSQHPEMADPAVLPATGKDIVVGFAMRTPFFFGMEKQIRKIMGPKRPYEVAEPGPQHVSSRFTRDLPVGSNTFAVAPNRTPDGKTHLAVNSHQPFEGPVAWYEARMKSEEGYDMVGGTFPGAPIILHGHNPDLGWAHTVNLPDLSDIYLLEMHPDDPNKYLYDGEYRELERDTATIWVRLWGNLRIPVKREILRCVYGPVIRRPHGVYALRYAGYGDIRQVEQWYRMGKARTMEQFEEAMRIRGIPSFNVGYADKTGNIWYLYNALLPMRNEKYDWQGLLPGNTSETLWTEYLPFEQLPQVKNPPSGFIQNCNSSPFLTTVGEGNPNPDDYSVAFGIEAPDNMTNRALRARETFGADDSITEEEFYAYKYDWRYSEKSRAAGLRTYLLENVKDPDPVIQEALEVLRTWDGAGNPENTGIAIGVLSMEPVVRAEMFGHDVPDVVELFKERAHQLKATYGKIAVPWQEINRVVRGELSMGVGGGPDMLHCIYGDWDGKQLRAVAGDCYILLVTWDAQGKVHSRAVHQYGSATLDARNPHYADQVPLFVNRQPRPVWLDKKELMQHAKARYRPGAYTWDGKPSAPFKIGS